MHRSIPDRSVRCFAVSLFRCFAVSIKEAMPKTRRTLDELAAELADLLNERQLGSDIRLFEGHALKETDLPEVVQLQAAGASWDWVALSVRYCDFWEFHVGMLPNAQGSGFEVGIHWLERMDADVRPWVTAHFPEGRVNNSVTTAEYQLRVSPLQEQSIFETAALALSLAVEATLFFSSIAS